MLPCHVTQRGFLLWEYPKLQALQIRCSVLSYKTFIMRIFDSFIIRALATPIQPLVILYKHVIYGYLEVYSLFSSVNLNKLVG